MTPAHRTVASLLVYAAASQLLGACANREHMRDDFGEKTRAFREKQHVYADAAMDSPKGLDSEEAALIQATYRKDLGGKSEDSEGSDQVIVLESPKGGRSK